MILHGPKPMQEIAMDPKLDRKFGVSIVLALVLAITIKTVMPSATAAGIEMAQIQVQKAVGTDRPVLAGVAVAGGRARIK